MEHVTQQKIIQIVTDYLEMFPEEFEEFKRGIAKKQAGLKDKKFASTGGEVFQRASHEVPEALYGMLTHRLSEDETEYWKSKKGALWFVKKFPAFRIAEVI